MGGDGVGGGDSRLSEYVISGSGSGAKEGGEGGGGGELGGGGGGGDGELISCTPPSDVPPKSWASCCCQFCAEARLEVKSNNIQNVPCQNILSRSEMVFEILLRYTRLNLRREVGGDSG